jgi:DNA-binding GntR family transcriptional regulator
MIKVGNANSSPVNGSPGMKKRIRAAPKSANRPALQFRVSREGQSLRSMTVASLRKAILSLHLKPGEKLTERELCELTGVSRSLMREALRDLEAQGLISNVPHKGPAVAMLTRNDAREIYEVRSALEPMAAKLFVERATDEQISELHAMADRCRHAMAKRNVLALIDALEGFYKTLFAGAGNQMAAMLARMIYNKAGLLRAVTFQRQTDIDAKRSMDHIVRIAAAIRSRDADAAAAACLMQVKRSREVAMRLLDLIEHENSAVSKVRTRMVPGRMLLRRVND